jgi:hypothetical protein
MRTRKLRRSWAAAALAAGLVAAPAAQARLDEGAGTPATPAPTQVVVTADDGFSWADAGIGAGVALGAVVLAGSAGHSLRRRQLPAHS